MLKSSFYFLNCSYFSFGIFTHAPNKLVRYLVSQDFTHRESKTDFKVFIEISVDLIVLKKSIASKEIKKQIKWINNGIDIVGCELAQNIAKKLKEK